MILSFQVQDDLFQRQPLCFMYRDRIGRAQREVGARTVTFFVFESPRDREDGNVVGAGELGPIVIIDFYHNRSWHVFDRILTLVPDDIPHRPYRPVHQAILNPDIVWQHDPRP
jgi:hypothetical protein